MDKYSEMVMKMIIYEYSQEAPITKGIGANSEEIQNMRLETSKVSIKSPFSILAFFQDKCIGIAKGRFDNPKANRIAAIGDEITKNFSYFIPNCKKLFVLHILFVQPYFGGKGIATKLTEKSIQLARENECDYIMSVPSNIKSAHIFTKSGFELAREIPFDAFKENGQPFLKDLGDGNKCTRLMFLKIS
uniref:N-acetyltransferase domain-containing protein n=1 Tax=Panagrolaimus davidi TaxID=227884 RepID=A0A914QDT0_9BILA